MHLDRNEAGTESSKFGQSYPLIRETVAMIAAFLLVKFRFKIFPVLDRLLGRTCGIFDSRQTPILNR